MTPSRIRLSKGARPRGGVLSTNTPNGPRDAHLHDHFDTRGLQQQNVRECYDFLRGQGWSDHEIAALYGPYPDGLAYNQRWR